MLDNCGQAELQKSRNGAHAEPFHRERYDALMNIRCTALIEVFQLKIALTGSTKVTLKTGSGCLAITDNGGVFTAMRTRNVYLGHKKNEEDTR